MMKPVAFFSLAHCHKSLQLHRRRERKERGNGKGGEWAGGKEGKMGDVREGQGEVGGNLGE